MVRITPPRLTVKRRPRAAHLGPERRRPLVLDAALLVFLERGYRSTSMQAIADAAGVTKPVVYECFPNKDKLLLALLDREEQRLLDAIMDALPDNPSFDNLEAVIASGLSAFLAAATQATDAWRVVFDSQHGAGTVVAERVTAARGMLVGRLRDLVELYLETLEVDDIERKSPVLTELFAGLAECCARMLIVQNYPWTAPELAGYVAKLITRGIERS